MRCGRATLRSAILVLPLFGWLSPTSAATWISQEGDCYQVQGFWAVEQEPSGVWAGDVDYRHIGGDCAAPTGQTQAFEARAAIVGEDFFAILRGSQTCSLHGRVRGENVRGFGFCLDSKTTAPFVLRLSPDPASGR